MHEMLERSQIVGERPALQRVQIGLAIIETNRDRRIAVTEQHEVDQQTRGAAVTVAERVDGCEAEMPLEGAIRRCRRV